MLRDPILFSVMENPVIFSLLPEPVPVSAVTESGEDEPTEPEIDEPPHVATDETVLSAWPADSEAVPVEAAVGFVWEESPREPEIVPVSAERVSEPAIAATASLAPEDSIISSAEFEAASVEPDRFAAAEEIEPLSDAPMETDPDGEPVDAVETLGGDEFEEAERQRSRTFRHYKIQEVTKRRQIMLVQVTKEERGNKGAALTTYLSLAGRYCVLMPNTGRGGGVSRKITSIGDRRRLKDILEDLDIPEGMGVIVRTAGGERSKAEIKRDYEYLLRLWNEIRDLTLRSTAPALIYEEGNLIKRSIRDLYTRDIDEVLVEGEEGYRTAKAFMKMLMPSHAKRVQPYRDEQIGLFHRFQVESQIDAIHSPVVQLRSGGYVVINQTEALVAIDVNSGRSTRERNIEETATRTNLEAAEEIARQLRLRDLAGLIVIDFIDMEEHRNQSAVERRLKDALKSDRARIQVGRISAFGLLEMSRQRLRPSLVETSTQPCPHCGGTGSIRSTESTALYVLRSIEEEGMRRRSAEISVHVPTTVALYILNQKRDSLVQLESRYAIRVMIAQDDALVPPTFRIERLRAYLPAETPVLATVPLTQGPEEAEEEEEEEAENGEEEAAEETPDISADQESGEERGRSRRRRRRRRRHDGEPASRPAELAAESGEQPGAEGELAADDVPAEGEDREGDEQSDTADRRHRRRGRRGGRQRGRRETSAETGFAGPRPASDTVEILPAPAIEENEPMLVEARADWSSEMGSVTIETASLPALAGDPATEHGGIVATTNGDLPSAGTVENTGADVAHPQAIGAPADDEASQQAAPAIAESEDGLPFLSENERMLETATAEHERKPDPAAHPIQAMTEKPINPRRGWWQRLIQS